MYFFSFNITILLLFQSLTVFSFFLSFFFFLTVIYLFIFCLFAISRAAPAAYGGSQARGLIGAVAAGLHHSSQQRLILNPLNKGRDQTRNLMVPSRIR